MSLHGHLRDSGGIAHRQTAERHGMRARAARSFVNDYRPLVV
ncbi:hypothetical protein C7S17_6400 [Burkholderia thailandensis]|nr:hypothetical protein [Burkholderia thailandensis]